MTHQKYIEVEKIIQNEGFVGKHGKNANNQETVEVNKGTIDLVVLLFEKNMLDNILKGDKKGIEEAAKKVNHYKEVIGETPPQKTSELPSPSPTPTVVAQGAGTLFRS